MNRIIFSTVIIILLSACSEDNPQQALGTLERDHVTLTATSNEIILVLPVKEGSLVHKNDVLVQLDSKNQQAILAHAVAEQAKAAAYLLKITNGERPEDIASASARVTRAETQLTEVQKNYQRIAELVRKRLISQSEKDSALAARDSAKAELRAAKAELSKLTAGARPEDIAQAQAELTAVRANVALQEQKLAELTITATRDGILDSLPYNLGERVPVNGVVAVIQANGAPYARVYIPAKYRINFSPGKAVTVHVDGLDRPLQGSVRWVATEPSFTPYFALTEEERSRLMYLAEVELPDTAKFLPSGLPAQVDLTEEVHD